MKKSLIFTIIFLILYVFISGCSSPPQQTASYPTCIQVKCVPKPNDPGKPLCTSSKVYDFADKICNKPSAPIVGTWEGYGTTQYLSNAKFVFSNDHMVKMTGIPFIGSQTANWYRCGDELDCLNQGLDNSNYIILSGTYNNDIIHYDGTSNSVDFQGSKLVKQ